MRLVIVWGLLLSAMASYDFFTQPRGPNIDLDLFPRAALQGAQRQNITGTPLSNAVEGITTGIKTGIGIAAGIQDISSQALQDDIRTEQLAQEKIETQNAQLKQQVIQNNQDIILETENNKLKQAHIESEQKLEDSRNTNLITDVLTNGTTQEKAGLLLSPSFQGTLFRNEKLANQLIGNLEASGVDPAIIKKARSTFDAVELQKQRQALALAQERAQQQFAASAYNDFVPALAYLNSNSNGFLATTKEQGFNPNNLKLFKNGTVNVKDGTIVVRPDGSLEMPPIADPNAQGYSLAYGNRIIDNSISDLDGQTFKKNLDTVKSYLASQFPKIAGTQVQNTAVSAATPTAQPAPTPGAPMQGVNASQAAPTPVPSTQNKTIVEAARARNQQFEKQAQSQGNTSYNAMIEKGRSLSNISATTVQPNYLSTSQATPQIRNAPALTKPATPNAEVNTVTGGVKHISNVLGGAPVYPNFDTKADQLTIRKETIDRVSGIPELENKPAIFKGLVAVESAGKANAVSPAGAVGLTQLREGAAEDVGLSPEERFDPAKNLQGGADYLEQRYRSVEKSLKKAVSDQGMPLQVDPRIVLAAYNGGDRDVLAAIRRGLTTWDEVKTYLQTVKSPKAAKENTTYPDKVIAASFPFVVGGNASDDAYLQTLLNFRILQLGV